MSIFSKVKKALTNNNINTESASQTSSKADAIEAFELQRHDFRDRQFRDKVEGVFDDIRHECFPKKVKAIFEDTSDQYVDQLTFKMISPQGLTVSVDLRESELRNGEKDIGLKKYIKDVLAKETFEFIGNLQLQEHDMPTFITNYDLQEGDNLTYFHLNEDLLVTAGLNMYYSVTLDDYPANNDSEVKTFSKDDLVCVKNVITKIQDYLDLERVVPLKGTVPAINGFFVDIVTLQLKNPKGKFQFNVFPIQYLIRETQKEQAYYAVMLDSFHKYLDNLSPRLAMTKYANGLKGLSKGEVEDELSQLKDLISNLPDDYSELKN